MRGSCPTETERGKPRARKPCARAERVRSPTVPLPVDVLLPALQPWLQAPRWWLALSGGLDSTSLLHMLVQLRDQQTLPPLTALHVDHQLTGQSARWAAACRELCAAWGVALECRQVTVSPSGAGLEAAARAARYAVFAELLGRDEVLLLAHHRDDQVETFFLRLLRGAGLTGLRAMPQQRRLGRGHLLRPLLNCTGTGLRDYAGQHALSWVEDASNRDQSFDRNYLRQTVLPQLEARWPGFRGNVLAAVAAIAAADGLLQDRYRAELATRCGTHWGEPTLALTALQDRTEHDSLQLIRLWLSGQGLTPPGRARLREFVRQLRTAATDTQPCLRLGAVVLRRYRNRLYLGAVATARPAPARLAPATPLDWGAQGCLEMRPAPRGGLRLPAAGYWQLGLRAGGERCRPRGRAVSRSLKKLLQEAGVPPWRRRQLPLLFDGTALAAVAGVCECEGFAPAAGHVGYRLMWQPPGPAAAASAEH